MAGGLHTFRGWCRWCAGVLNFPVGSVKLEVHFDDDLRLDGLAIFLCRGIFPLLDGLFGGAAEHDGAG